MKPKQDNFAAAPSPTQLEICLVWTFQLLQCWARVQEGPPALWSTELCFDTFGPNLGPVPRGAGFGLKADGSPCWARAPTEAGSGEEGYLVLSTQPSGSSLAHICSEWLHHGTKPGLWGQMPHGPHTAAQQVACGPACGVTVHSLPHRDPAERGGAPSKPACSSPPHLRETTDKLPLWLKLERDWGSLGDSIPFPQTASQQCPSHVLFLPINTEPKTVGTRIQRTPWF